MRVGILGAGAIAFASASVLAAAGHQATLWSPSGRSTASFGPRARIVAKGAITGACEVTIAATAAQAVAGADAVLIAVDAGGHVAVMEAAAPHLVSGQVVMVSAAHSLGALVLSKLAAARGTRPVIVSWSTSIGTASKTAVGEVDMRSVRPRIQASVMPYGETAAALGLCAALFGDRFEARADAIEIGLLANANPVFHVPAMLLNVARIEHGETWAPYAQTTVAVGRLMEALDRERIALGAALGATIHSVNEHFHRSFEIPLGTMAEMNATLAARGRGPRGPTSTAHRFLAQDIPYGLVFAAALARRAGVPAPVHEATITLADAALGRDHRAENAILSCLRLEDRPWSEIVRLATEGWLG
ncbi:NAD/NADP octopine/nopaline dehydrogenase family protein [Rhodoplanes sp. TEM]|uniref:NAD/NADP octopine/nopaline dehydrogenase family protein n=1 Tax=Rhodoplanes tepidamans TaxID=200616 RepID=A0ABT5J7A2_RHOTP|nr:MULTISPECIES: NAD/NADP-dependent octopine/nopaline dehydrogenase family protein [Rhodoplanes]MDC7785533.1 NAD/NADP octopine/nopaline dehydrogenase family protein [Rhodoplanes tepidamans]MDC7986185.1 NAD/NADP octopine/nopaline dehydrogenase family protein [Rhodoplanes sp. TEM]MDQ0353297.1 opine dehydrogenase [Rhodoplanes tepidamans]